MQKSYTRLAILLASSSLARAYPNGAPNARLPTLGWSSWIALGPAGSAPVFDFCDEASVKASADAFVSLGLFDAGYRHFHLRVPRRARGRGEPARAAARGRTCLCARLRVSARVRSALLRTVSASEPRVSDVRKRVRARARTNARGACEKRCSAARAFVGAWERARSDCGNDSARRCTQTQLWRSALTSLRCRTRSLRSSAQGRLLGDDQARREQQHLRRARPLPVRKARQPAPRACNSRFSLTRTHLSPPPLAAATA